MKIPIPRHRLFRHSAAPALRLKMALGESVHQAGKALRWLVSSKETTNFTYDLTSINRSHLVAMLSHVTGTSPARIESYFGELETDRELARHVAETTRSSASSFKSDSIPRYHKRLGWYALTRILKPRLVIETGVDKGLGSVVLSSALLRNAAEGEPGRYLGTDINPAAGFLLSGRYAKVGEILYGDSLTSLAKIQGPVDIFINDSDHSAEYEGREYREILSELSERSVILGDNAHVTDELQKFSEQQGRSFLFWQEAPANHWYRGAGIGISWKSPSTGWPRE